MNWKIQYCKEVNSYQIDLLIQCQPQLQSRLLYRNRQAHSKTYVEMQRTWKSQDIFGNEKQICRISTILCQLINSF